MALLGDIYITADKLKTLADTVTKKGEKGISLTFSVDDKTNEYGQGWLVIGAESQGAAPLDYNIGQLKIITTESKDANTVTTE
jgi:hypothetical protein